MISIPRTSEDVSRLFRDLIPDHYSIHAEPYPGHPGMFKLSVENGANDFNNLFADRDDIEMDFDEDKHVTHSDSEGNHEHAKGRITLTSTESPKHRFYILYHGHGSGLDGTDDAYNYWWDFVVTFAPDEASASADLAKLDAKFSLELLQYARALVRHAEDLLVNCSPAYRRKFIAYPEMTKLLRTAAS